MISITFTCDGNPSMRPSLLQDGLMLINVDKYAKLGKIAADFRRFQEVSTIYTLAVHSVRMLI
jgi:son of sevenless-like protein